MDPGCTSHGNRGAVTCQQAHDVISVTMSLHDRLLEDAKKDLKQAEREMQRQMRLMDLHLRQLHEKLPVSCLCSPARCPCCLHQPSRHPWERMALTTRLDVEQDLGSMQRRLNRVLNSSHDRKLLALMDVEGFDPKEVTVTVKDGKVKVLAEHEEEHTTTKGKTYNYKNITKEVSLPPGVSEDEVTYSLEPNSIVKIEIARKCYPCSLSR
ncbi:outer dense fiber protein 1 [Phalacrocorax aristotelis]|uniref:outer dense fiber protein 1 n=1 Tax=Phalacrocorax aristotelis TaxID=126867 RepID=UPI003F4B41E0